MCAKWCLYMSCVCICVCSLCGVFVCVLSGVLLTGVCICVCSFVVYGMCVRGKWCVGVHMSGMYMCVVCICVVYVVWGWYLCVVCMVWGSVVCVCIFWVRLVYKSEGKQSSLLSVDMPHPVRRPAENKKVAVHALLPWDLDSDQRFCSQPSTSLALKSKLNLHHGQFQGSPLPTAGVGASWTLKPYEHMVLHNKL